MSANSGCMMYFFKVILEYYIVASWRSIEVAAIGAYVSVWVLVSNLSVQVLAA